MAHIFPISNPFFHAEPGIGDNYWKINYHLLKK